MTSDHHPKITPERTRLYLQFLRKARAEAQEDAENFDDLVRVFERIGAMEKGELCRGLRSYGRGLLGIARRSPLHETLPERYPSRHINGRRLFELLCNARNSAVHQGAVARNLVRHTIEFSLILEHSLAQTMNKASDLMIRDIMSADLHHPISYLRQQILLYAYSYLPVYLDDQGWRLVSDRILTCWLHAMQWEGEDGQVKALAMTLEEAIKPARGLQTESAPILPSNCDIAEVLKIFAENVPLVVLHEPGNKARIEGLLTPSDLL
ncbi:MAG: CBS domain-containing protein [Opitutaceae bacterium]|nr:CBS domain-containing protein [Opitutaceae bacterium]